MMKTKKCTRCKLEKPLSEFPKRKGTKDGLKESCKICTNLRSKLFSAHSKRYRSLYNAQRGRCAICGRHQSELKRRFDIDHNHQTGLIRGLLCQRCNIGIGYHDEMKSQFEKYLRDSPKRMIKLYRLWLQELESKL